MRVLSPRMLPPESGLDGSTLSTATFSPQLAHQMHAQRIDERALADPRHAGDSDPPRAARYAAAARPTRRAASSPSDGQVALDHRDGAGEDDAVPAEHAVDIRLSGEPRGARVPMRRRCRTPSGRDRRDDCLDADNPLDGTRTPNQRVENLLRATGITVPGPNTPVTPAWSRAS